MSLEQNLQAFQRKYTTLEQQATQGSVERHVYNQIVTFINATQNVTPAKQRAFETQIALVSLTPSPLLCKGQDSTTSERREKRRTQSTGSDRTDTSKAGLQR